jgi:antimicrobial peptide system SdpB family protein
MKWSNVYGLGRSLLALGTLLTLLFNPSNVLYQPGPGAGMLAHAPAPLLRIGIFALLSNHLELARWLSIFFLALAAGGWRPRLTAPLHWWVTFSHATISPTLDGGDHVAAVLTLLLLPIALTDPRTWHWSAPVTAQSGFWGELRQEIAASTAFVIRLQIAGIYFHAAMAKFSVPQWADGTAVYYWTTSPIIGAPSAVQSLLHPILSNAYLLSLTTWGVLALEVALFTGLVANRQVRAVLLPLGLCLHAAIIVLHGLVSFFFAMAGALVLFLRPFDQPFAWPHGRLSWRRWRTIATGQAVTTGSP